MKTTEEELDYIVRAARRFYKEAGFDFPDNAKEYYTNLLSNDIMFTKVIIGKGFVVGFVAPSFLQPSKKLCSELAWYVEPMYRGTTVALKLMKMYEREASERGCDQVSMVCLESLDPETTGDIYTRLGYKKLESHYIKELRWQQ